MLIWEGHIMRVEKLYTETWNQRHLVVVVDYPVIVY